MEKIITIHSVVKEMLENFTRSTRVSGSEYYHTKESIEWQSDIICEAHIDRMPNDDTYDRVHTFLCNFSNLDEDSTFDEYLEETYNVEADSYTSDLTTWLNRNNHNVYYLTQALEEFDIKDGFQALAMGQQEYLKEIGYALLNAINDYVEENQE